MQSPAAAPALKAVPTANGHKSLPAAITALLELKGVPLSPAQIVDGLDTICHTIGGKNKLRIVNACLGRGKAKGAFSNPERGQWTLPEPQAHG